MMPERPQNRWYAFCKVCVVLWMQMALTIAAVLISRQSVHLSDHPIAIADCIAICILAHISLSLVCHYYNLYPSNWFLRLLLTTYVACIVQLACVYAFPVVPIIRAATLTFGVVFGLILLTSWAVKRGHDLGFLAPLLLPCAIEICVFILIQFYYPQWRTFMPMCNAFRALVCCGYIVYFSRNLVRHSSSEDNILDSISLFFTIVTLFLSFINMTFGLG